MWNTTCEFCGGPDLLLQPHDASIEMAFYKGAQFPSEYQGGIFAAEHGSWNRSIRSSYEVVYVPLHHGKAAGEFEDFLTGFVLLDCGVGGTALRRRSRAR